MPPVILLHAFPLDGRMWAPQVEALPDAMAPDLRGFGTASEHALREIPIDLAADDLARFLDQRGIAQAVVGGISRGAYIAMAFARRHRERLLGLMIFDSRATPADETEQRNWAQMAERLETEGVEFLPGVMQARLLGANAPPELADRVRAIILSQEPGSVAAAARGMATRPDARAGLAAIWVPVLVAAGSEDAAFASTLAIAEAIPGSTFVTIPAAGHLSNLEQPALVTAAIRRFLELL